MSQRATSVAQNPGRPQAGETTIPTLHFNSTQILEAITPQIFRSRDNDIHPSSYLPSQGQA